MPLQAVEAGTDLGAVLEQALAAAEPDPEAEFVAYLREVLDTHGDDLSREDLEWMLAESGLESVPELPDDVAAPAGRPRAQPDRPERLNGTSGCPGVARRCPSVEAAAAQPSILRST